MIWSIQTLNILFSFQASLEIDSCFACDSFSHGIGTICFTAAGSDKVEKQDKEVQTEITERENKHVQPDSLAKQHGEYGTGYDEWFCS